MHVRSMAALIFCLMTNFTMQSDDATWTFGAFDKEVTKISFRTPLNSADDKAVKSIASSLTNMEGRYLAKYGTSADTESQIATNLSPQFSQSMTENLDLLDHLPSDRTERLRVLEGVRDDFVLKEKFSSLLMGEVATSFPLVVMVRVTIDLPKRGSIDPSFLSVRSSSCGRGQQPPGHVIGTGPGPFETKMSPGCFLIWIQDDNSMQPAFREEIGDGGQTIKELTLAAR